MDYLSLKAAVAEANSKLSGSKISDAWQAGSDEIVLITHKGPGLLLSIDPARPGIYLLEKGEHPGKMPSPLTDLLRARIKGTTLGIVDITEAGERVVTLTFAAAWPVKKGAPLEMVVEIMGRRSNLMLVEGGRILQPLRGVSKEKSPARPVVAGEPYLPPPPREGVPVEEVSSEDLTAFSITEGANTLQNLVRGLSPYAASQALNMALKGDQEGDPGTVPDGGSVVKALEKMVASGTGENGFLHLTGGKVHLSPFKPAPYGDSDTIEQFTPFSDAASAWRDSNPSDASGIGDEWEYLERLLRQRLERIEAATGHLDIEEERCRSHDDLRVMAQALLIGVKRVEAGADLVTLPDPYDAGLTVTIPLDPAKSPQENANDLFARARRLKRGLDEVHVRRGKLDEEKASVSKAMGALTERKDKEPARRLLEGITLKKSAKGKTVEGAYSGPGRRYIVDGFTILVGKSSTDNEKVTFKAAGPNDLWLHARDYPGSHVVIITEKRHVPDKVLYEAAALAAAGSGAKNDTAPEIMVTERKWIRKLKGGKPGQVTVEKFRTVRPRRNF